MPDVDRVINLIARAEQSGVSLRIVGSVAVQLYALSSKAGTKRPDDPKDIDLVGLKADHQRIQHFLFGEGWKLDKNLLLFAEDRETYESKEAGYTIDVFFDHVDGSHPIELKSRLGCHGPAVRPEDLLLTKLQRQFLRSADIWDCCILLDALEEDTDLTFYRRLLSSNWGLYTTVLDNLEFLAHECDGETRSIALLIEAATSAKKSWTWKARALLGRHVKWWKEVYDADGGRQGQ